MSARNRQAGPGPKYLLSLSLDLIFLFLLTILFLLSFSRPPGGISILQNSFALYNQKPASNRGAGGAIQTTGLRHMIEPIQESKRTISRVGTHDITFTLLRRESAGYLAAAAGNGSAHALNFLGHFFL
jgi:hypothetical protein